VSAFVGRFWWGLQRFFEEEKPIPADETVLKTVAMWHYDWHTNAQEKFQIRENGCKVCDNHWSTSAI